MDKHLNEQLQDESEDALLVRIQEESLRYAQSNLIIKIKLLL